MAHMIGPDDLQLMPEQCLVLQPAQAGSRVLCGDLWLANRSSVHPLSYCVAVLLSAGVGASARATSTARYRPAMAPWAFGVLQPGESYCQPFEMQQSSGSGSGSGQSRPGAADHHHHRQQQHQVVGDFAVFFCPAPMADAAQLSIEHFSRAAGLVIHEKRLQLLVDPPQAATSAASGAAAAAGAAMASQPAAAVAAAAVAAAAAAAAPPAAAAASPQNAETAGVATPAGPGAGHSQNIAAQAGGDDTGGGGANTGTDGEAGPAPWLADLEGGIQAASHFGDQMRTMWQGVLSRAEQVPTFLADSIRQPTAKEDEQVAALAARAQASFARGTARLQASLADPETTPEQRQGIEGVLRLGATMQEFMHEQLAARKRMAAIRCAKEQQQRGVTAAPAA